MGNAAQVEAEMKAWGMAKWEAVVAGGDGAAEILDNEVKSRTPVDTGSSQEGVGHEINIIGKDMFTIRTLMNDVTNPKSGASTKAYADCLEYGGPCPKGQSRKAHMMFRSGSLAAKDKMDAHLASLF